MKARRAKPSVAAPPSATAELRARLREALEQQVATGEILKVISSSSSDVQPVFDTIIQNAVRLGGGDFGTLFRVAGDRLEVGAHCKLTPELHARYQREFPQALSRGSPYGLAIVERRVVNVPDLQEAAPSDASRQRARALDVRAVLAVPMLLDGAAQGALVVGRREAGAFSESYVSLLKTFADQAVIAIANVRLFNEMRREIEAHRKSKSTIQYLVEEICAEHRALIGESPALRRVLAQIAQVAPTGSTVLIQGETGTGKELVARAIHDGSQRRERPLVKLNCAALPRELVESELFGHEKGAFTGAVQQRRGRFELADGGTLFLDEVGELPPDTQAKLLRVLQEREFERVGGTRSLQVDVRIVAATNRDLHSQVAAGRFRSDLYFRLNVFPIVVPPLRERREDIPRLVQHFAAKAARKLGRPLEGVSSAFMERAAAYDWPGNIRELENVVERAMIMSQGSLLDGADLLAAAAQAAPGSAVPSPAVPSDATLQEIERAHIRRVLEAARWVVEGDRGAARVLGLNPSTLRGRIRKLGIRKTS